MKMKAFTREKLKPLIEKNQRTLTLDDVDAIIELDEIACRIEKGIRNVEERDWFMVGDRFYTQPTFARLDLIDRINAKYCTKVFNLLGILYSLDMDTEDFDKTPTLIQLIGYRRKVKATIGEITRKLEDNLPKGESGTEDKGGYWRLCCILARELNGTPSEWMNATPSKIESAVDVINEKIEAEAKAMGGKSGPPKETPRLLAIKEFREKLNALEATWLA
jgi:hypothetical protein